MPSGLQQIMRSGLWQVMPWGLRRFSTAVLRLLVVAQPHERRVADAAVVGPVSKAHLADQDRLYPVVAAAGRNRARLEGRGLASQGLQPRHDGAQRGLVEAGSDLRDVDEARRRGRALVEAQVQRAELTARTLRIRVAADHELLMQLALDLHPIAGAAARVRALRLLGDDALEALLERGVEEREALAHDVVAVARGPERGHQAAQALLALDERQSAQIAIVEHEAVEEHAHYRPPGRGQRDVSRIGQGH